MRPEILFPAFAPIGSLPGCGPKLAKLIGKFVGPKVADLWWHLPSGLIDRRLSPKAAEAPAGVICTMELTVDKHLKPRHRRLPYKVRCSDESGSIDLVFFHAVEEYLIRVLPVGSRRVISGRVEYYDGQAQMPHPDRIVTPEEAETLKTVEPVYPLTAGLTLRPLAKIIGAALSRAPDIPEWLEPRFLAARGWPKWRAALMSVHRPGAAPELEPLSVARMRLAYDELLANQLALGLVRKRMKRQAGRAVRGDGRLSAKILAALPFRLTAGQQRAIAEIAADLGSDQRMLRLLQGDVGSGKTVVALLAMTIAVESGGQAALMAPTEILARQHYQTIETLARPAGLRLALLTGRSKGLEREGILSAIAEAQVDIVIGTHALFQEGVAFHDLVMAVIDEQHRFGVHQRLNLAAKGQRDKGGVDVLVMTATPIPRTLALTAYGDLDISQLPEKPPGRGRIDSRALPLERLDEVIAAVRRKIATGARAYWICPLLEDREDSDLAAAQARYNSLQETLGPRVGLVHGRLKAPERDAVMEKFALGAIELLVATTVVEVGVDVPEASLMVIEHAERFGLAQLHQLRGRVGRGTQPGTCLLLYAPPLSQAARARLAILRETSDGFRIAEEDLRLRGPGEILGTKQSGVPGFHLADLSVHGDLLTVARDDAKLVLETDPALQSPRGRALRILLYLFEREAAVAYFRSG
jgi:ATP-dependent DNA helicase RecG